MTRLFFAWTPFVLFANACVTKGTLNGDANGGSDSGVSDSDASGTHSCPDHVPEEYAWLWDCTASTCDGGRAVYHLGIGSSTASGAFTMEEKWYWFWDDGEESCTDTFSIVGERSSNPFADSSSDPCSYCEEVYAVEWELTTSECSVGYESMFDNEDVDEELYDGYLMMDTHTTLTEERNEDDAVAVIALYRDQSTSGTYGGDYSYANGTATPSSSEDGPPEDYEWVNTSPLCVTVSR